MRRRNKLLVVVFSAKGPAAVPVEGGRQHRDNSQNSACVRCCLCAQQLRFGTDGFTRRRHVYIINLKDGAKIKSPFLVQFGLRDLNELPTLKEFEELRRMAFTDTEELPPEPAPASPETEAETTPEPA